MMWRALALYAVLMCGCYVYRIHGEEAASAVAYGLGALLLALGKIEERLGELVEAQRKRAASK